MKMKKYLMTGIAALALCAGFTSCSHDLEPTSQEDINKMEAQKIVDKYNKAFVAVFGQPAASQTWGFGSSTRTRSGNTTAAGYVQHEMTHTYTDASGKVIAGANMNHNLWATPYSSTNIHGGWVVPDPLTPEQKLRVQLYFQNNTPLSNYDPHYAHFFVQQVYTGGTNKPTTGNGEVITAADGSTASGDKLNQLTVGVANSHINNFNAGTCSPSDVLQNDGTTETDQITLMVNVDDTSCFGYHDPQGSNVKGKINHNDKWALVSAKDIDDWAASDAAKALNVDLGASVQDKWNRSFMGFDYELLPEEDLVKDEYAMLSNWDGNRPEYVYDGTNVKKIVTETLPAGTKLDLTSTFNNSWNGTMTTNGDGEITFVSNGGAIQAGYFGNDIVNNWSKYAKFVIEFKDATTVATSIQLGSDTYEIAANTTKFELDITNISAQGATINVPSGNTIVISKIYIEAGESDGFYTSPYLLAGGTSQISFYTKNTDMYGGIIKNVSSQDMTIEVNGKTCINLDWIKTELYDKGYHPITTDLKEWVKYQPVSDGYYSDWIVTLTEAKRQDEEQDPEYESLRVMAEDLSAVDDTDFDFNDVVFDVIRLDDTTAKIILQAAGGTLKLRINSNNGNGGWEVHEEFGVDTNVMVNTNWTGSNKASKPAKELGTVTGNFTKTNFAQAVKAIRIEVFKNNQWIEMEAKQGQPCSKFGCPVGTQWVDERTPINKVYMFNEWVAGYITDLLPRTNN
jgi:hypothetical protein